VDPLIVLCTLLIVGKDLIRLVHFLEFSFIAAVLVGMILMREFMEGFFDIVL
jgi:hypothetical protein